MLLHADVPPCRALKQLYEEKLAAGAFEVIRPRTSAESDGEIRAMLRSLAADMADMRSNMRVHQDEVLALVRDQGRFVQPRLTNVSEAEDLAQQPRLEDILAAGGFLLLVQLSGWHCMRATVQATSSGPLSLASTCKHTTS